MNCWILQSNINHFRWLDYIKEHKNDPDTWGINPRQKRFINEIESGDIAFIWLTKYRGKETRGIYAMAEITGLPEKDRKPFPYEKPYWINKEERDRIYQYPRLEIRYTNTKFVDKFISKDELEAAGLGNLLILKWPRATIYKVTEEYEAIKKLVEKR